MLTNERPDPQNQEKVHCYGNNAALTIEATFLKNKGETINIDLAPKDDQNVVDWRNKITIQLSEEELPILASVCLGYLPKCHLKRPNKGIEIERQTEKLFFKGTAGKGNAFLIPVPIGNAFQVTSLVLRQLQKQSSLSDGTLLVSALRGCAALYKPSKN